MLFYGVLANYYKLANFITSFFFQDVEAIQQLGMEINHQVHNDHQWTPPHAISVQYTASCPISLRFIFIFYSPVHGNWAREVGTVTGYGLDS